MVAYKYLKASPDYGKTQQEIYTGLFQETLNQQFINASDIWTIEEEVIFASEVYSNVDVRIVTHLISSDTGKPLGDDYKKILFKDLDHAVGLGYMYQFDNNYWLTINSEKTKNLAASSTVKRCNNILRWIDNAGAIHSEPCGIDYQILRNTDDKSPTAFLVLPLGTIEIICQYNNRTNLIRPNQRFLFGNVNNWTAYKVEGGGINNYQNTKTADNTTVGFIRLTMKADAISDNDDLTNGICYEDKNVYVLTLSESTIAGVPTNTRRLYATVTLNGTSVSHTSGILTSAVFLNGGTSRDSITRQAGGDFIADGFIENQQISVSGTSSNNGTFTVYSVSALVITVTAEDTLNNETSNAIITSTRNVLWSSSNTAKATVNSTGLVTLVANGAATITCALDGDLTVNDTVGVTVSSSVSDYYQVIISPDKNYVLEGDTQAYTVYLYKNGTIQGNLFTLSCSAGNVPGDHFAFSYSASPGNTFSIENKEMFLTDELTVTCTSVAIGSIPPSPEVKVLEITMKGVW